LIDYVFPASDRLYFPRHRAIFPARWRFLYSVVSSADRWLLEAVGASAAHSTVLALDDGAKCTMSDQPWLDDIAGMH
jgi:hypothetical protein